MFFTISAIYCKKKIITLDFYSKIYKKNIIYLPLFSFSLSSYHPMTHLFSTQFTFLLNQFYSFYQSQTKYMTIMHNNNNFTACFLTELYSIVLFEIEKNRKYSFKTTPTNFFKKLINIQFFDPVSAPIRSGKQVSGESRSG